MFDKSTKGRWWRRIYIKQALNILWKKNISIKYATPYVYEEIGLAEQGWHIIVTMKDSMLIDSRLLNKFWAEAIKTANYLQNRLLAKRKTHSEMIPKEA